MMRRFLLATFVSFYAMTTLAQLTSDGYYRIQNMGTKRYTYVKDDKGSVNIGSTSADLGALQLWSGFDRVVSDPSAVIYIKNVGGNNYRFHSQGTNSYTIVGYDLKIKEYKKDEIYYRAYQSKGGMTSYLCDAETSERQRGKMSTSTVDAQYRSWYIHPVKSASNEYFGIKPTLTAGADHYAPFYAEFPFSFVSTGMKAYYIKKVEHEFAILQEITDKVVPAGIPVIIKCASEDPANNKVELLTSSTALPADNLLKGVYFCNLHGNESFHGSHWNTTDYVAETMRILSVSAEGKLVYVKSPDLKYLPANQSYLSVSAGEMDELKVVTQKEYDEIIAAGIDATVDEDKANANVYDLSGVAVGNGKRALNTLPAGVYLMSGKKYIVKK